jgi:hypothetical protein
MTHNISRRILLSNTLKLVAWEPEKNYKYSIEVDLRSKCCDNDKLIEATQSLVKGTLLAAFNLHILLSEYEII